MKNKKLNWYTSGGVEKHYDGSFTIFGYIENNDEEEVMSYKMRYMDYDFKEALDKFKIDLKDYVELLKDNNIYTHEAYLQNHWRIT